MLVTGVHDFGGQIESSPVPSHHSLYRLMSRQKQRRSTARCRWSMRQGRAVQGWQIFYPVFTAFGRHILARRPVLLRPYSINLVVNAFVHLYDSTGDFKPDLLKSEPLLLPVKRHVT
jgi:hypothetical protein